MSKSTFKDSPPLTDRVNAYDEAHLAILRNSGGPDDVDYGVCPACDGKREVEVECEPITIFDLENAEWY